MANKHDDNDGLHIHRIMNIVGCKRHKADINEACWNIPSIHGILHAICNHRAITAGAQGQVTPYTPKKKEYNR